MFAPAWPPGIWQLSCAHLDGGSFGSGGNFGSGEPFMLFKYCRGFIGTVGRTSGNCRRWRLR